jgi:hypothetical protein
MIVTANNNNFNNILNGAKGVKLALLITISYQITAVSK